MFINSYLLSSREWINIAEVKKRMMAQTLSFKFDVKHENFFIRIDVKVSNKAATSVLNG